ncbi:MAG: ester cyclase [Anaerolineae bacterium]|nr:ester cyclase [Anaerolineae bacterium]
MCRTERNRKLLADFFEVILNARDLTPLSSFLAPDFVNRTPLPGSSCSAEGFKRALTILFCSYHDLTYTWTNCIVIDERVIVRWVAEASHPGGLIGKKGVLVPIGRKLRWRGETTARIRDGHIEEWTTHQDVASLLEQLSYMPLVLVEN